jgi:cell division protein FtsL
MSRDDDQNAALAAEVIRLRRAIMEQNQEIAELESMISDVRIETEDLLETLARLGRVRKETV